MLLDTIGLCKLRGVIFGFIEVEVYSTELKLQDKVGFIHSFKFNSHEIALMVQDRIWEGLKSDKKFIDFDKVNPNGVCEDGFIC